MTARRPGMSPGRPEDELLGQLGLDGRASAEDVARRHDELVEFLSTAPRSLWPWARAQAAAVDDSFAALSDPSASTRSEALSGPGSRTAPQPGGPATPPARQAAPSGPEEGDDFESMLAAVTPTTHRDSVPTGRGASRPISTPLATAGRRASSGTTLPTNAPVFTDASGLGGLKKIAIVAVGLVAFAAVAYGIYQFGNTNAPSIASASPTPAASAGLDQAKVAALMAKYQANPNDTATLLALGNAFFAAQDYTSAAGWLDKVVALEPNNVQALLALGAAKFNLGDDAAAKTDWLKVVSLDAKNVEAHYDLGFLYFNATPQDVEGVRREWGQVVTLSPGSDVARVVQAHLDALTAQSSGAPSAAPSGGVSPAPSAAPSASGSPGPS